MVFLSIIRLLDIFLLYITSCHSLCIEYISLSFTLSFLFLNLNLWKTFFILKSKWTFGVTFIINKLI